MPAPMMAAIEIADPGKAGFLRATERPIPQPAADEILIRVAAAGVNRPDVLQRRGLYPPPAGASDLPGLEVAGIVVATGDVVTRFRPGDAVCALLAGGGYAAYAVVPEGQCLPVPAGLTLAEAASLPETHFTVWAALLIQGRWQPGESVLVHGGASGIGVTAIQLMHALGAPVYATTSSEERARRCEALGATLGIDHSQQDFVAILREYTAGRGVAVILDMVAGDYVPRNIEVAASGGRIVQIAFLRGSKVTVDIATLMQKRLTLSGMTLRSRGVAEKAAIAREIEARVWPMYAAGRMQSCIHARFPLAAAAEAHRLMESGTHVGKLVLIVDSALAERVPTGP